MTILSRNQTSILILKEAKMSERQRNIAYHSLLTENINNIASVMKQKGYDQSLINESVFQKIFDFIEDLGLSDNFGSRLGRASTDAFKQSIAKRIIGFIAPGFSESFTAVWIENIVEQLNSENIQMLMAKGQTRCEVVTDIIFDGLVEALGESFILDTVFGVDYAYSGGFVRNTIAKTVREYLTNALKEIEGLEAVKDSISDAVCSLDLGGFFNRNSEDTE